MCSRGVEERGREGGDWCGCKLGASERSERVQQAKGTALEKNSDSRTADRTHAYPWPGQQLSDCDEQVRHNAGVLLERPQNYVLDGP